MANDYKNLDQDLGRGESLRQVQLEEIIALEEEYRKDGKI
jgi:hypothetical protein